jgi:1,4-dihydroxy-2-naphthoate octaprenyltransferase
MTSMDRKNIPTWIAAVVAFLLAAICFSLIPSGWAIVVYGVLVFGIALIYRASSSKASR